LSAWLAKYPEASPDVLSHQGPFHMALRVQYELVERGDVSSPKFIDWRNAFNPLWESRRRTVLKPAQEALLRSRGWTGD
jgi:hypothetical protein